MKHPHTIAWAGEALIGGITLFCVLLLASCAPKNDSPQGFILPPGDAMKGQTTFAAVGCVNCHQVEGATFTDAGGDLAAELIVTIGGTQPKVKTYGQLVTAIIHPNADILQNNPSYVDAEGKSLMPDYTRSMTVQQMTDLVTFLQDHYEIELPEFDPYQTIYP